MAEKLFSESEIAGLETEFKGKIRSAMAAPDARQPVQFNKGWIEVITSGIASSVKWSAKKARAELAAEVEKTQKLAATVDGLEHRLSRQATHLQNLQNRIKDLETR